MPAHIHAESMIQYGHDALITDKPWELWECRPLTEEWKSLDEHPLWKIDTKYRRKQKTININGFEVPAQVREPLEVGTVYYVSSVLTEHLSVQAKALLSFTACATAST